jgi:energy-coupling factor transporter ATP-binding protein EcfA2
MDNDQYKAVFSVDGSGAFRQAPGTVLLYPDNPTWNDFGFQVRAKLRVRSPDGERELLLGAYVIVRKGDAWSDVESSFSNWVRTLVANGGAVGFANLSGLPPFLTLLSYDSAYRQLAEWSSSVEERWMILLALNDINQARLQQTVPTEHIDAAVSTDAFTLGVMRSSSAYRAFAKGGRYVTKQVLPWITDARQEFEVKVRLNGFDEDHEASFEFQGVPALVSDRVHVLIGKNGTGKSQLLNQVVGSLALKADATGSSVFQDKPNSSFRANAVSDRSLPNAVLVFSADGGLFPERSRLDTALSYSYFDFSAIPRDSSDELKTDSLGRALRDLIRDDTLLKDRTRFQVFKDVVSPVLSLPMLHIPIRHSTKNPPAGTIRDSAGNVWLSVQNIPGGEQQSLYLGAAVDTDRDVVMIDSGGREFPPSSGQRVYLRFAAQALSAIAQGSMLVLDEPETHLHPNFISEFMTLLHQVLEATNSIALVATHSPYVVREVPSRCVHVVAREKDVPKIGGVHLRTLGASVSSISDAVFGDPTAKKFHRLIAKKLAEQAGLVSTDESQQLSWIIDSFGEELNTEMLSTIRFMLVKQAS